MFERKKKSGRPCIYKFNIREPCFYPFPLCGFSKLSSLFLSLSLVVRSTTLAIQSTFLDLSSPKRKERKNYSLNRYTKQPPPSSIIFQQPLIVSPTPSLSSLISLSVIFAKGRKRKRETTEKRGGKKRRNAKEKGGGREMRKTRGKMTEEREGARGMCNDRSESAESS